MKKTNLKPLENQIYSLAHYFIVRGVGDGFWLPEWWTLLVLTIYFQANSLNGFQFIRRQTMRTFLTKLFCTKKNKKYQALGKSQLILHSQKDNVPLTGSSDKLTHSKHCHVSLSSGSELMFGMWQFWWNTLGHLSQHINSPPSKQTAHQSSFGSSLLPFFSAHQQ